ncbi:MAG: M81 family metallopeptidase [Anaerolineales bacterium]
MKRVMIGGIMHETNTFNPELTTLKEFKQRALFYGDEMIAKRRGTNTELGGFIEGLKKDNVEVVPSMFANARPSGLVTEAALQAFLDTTLGILQSHSVDGILLALHGAMATQEHDDAEGYLLQRLRETIDSDVPIVITLDLHTTLTPRMAANANAMVIYRTYPHMDMAARGREAAKIMLRSLHGEIEPTVAISKQPLLICPPLNVLPTNSPMKDIMARAREMEQENDQVIAACPAHGFAQQDVFYGGVGTAVTTDGDFALAQALADEMSALLFEHRREYKVDLPDPVETIRLAAASDNPPVAIADTGDNIGGGTPGDGTALLREILKQGVDSAFVPLWDPEAAALAARAGVGATVDLAVGGNSDPVYGPPVEIKGRVRTITDGVYLNRAWGGYAAGVVSDMGLSARIDMGGITIALNSIAASPNNIMHAKSMGIYPEDYLMSVCKGGLAFREAYNPPVANSYIQSDTPGYSSSNLSAFTWKRIRRPIAPLDDF